MGRILRLEDFGSGPEVPAPETTDGSRLEAERLAAFDQGYAAGWEDAHKAAAQEARDSDEAARSRLQDLGFTFHEARAHVMTALTPMLRAIVSHAVPQLIQRTLGQRLTEELEAMIEEAGEAEVEILVPVGDAAQVASAISEIRTLPVSIREDGALADGQIHLRLGRLEREIDLAELGRRLDDALSALDTLNKEALAHG